MSKSIISVKNLTKKFGDLAAVDNISFEVQKGEIFGFLGPNGAGKSTTLRMLTTLTAPTSGSFTINGLNPKKDVDQLKKMVGLVAEKLIMYDYLSARENLLFFGKLYKVPQDILEERTDKLLKMIGMWEWRDHKIGTYSTGMKQRINVIRALVTDPDIIFMDEPTLGLDPQSTRQVREFILELNKKGKTIILTTHIMQEAERLSDRVGIIDHGKIIALDTPENLKNSLADKRGTGVEFKVSEVPACMLDKLAKLPKVSVKQLGDNRISISYGNGTEVNKLIDAIQDCNVGILRMHTSEPTLEDVFIDLTGREFRDKATEKEQKMPAAGPGHGFRKISSRIR
ncbi:MAG: ABC transporter ATP-binding protein [Patescibacteria group bacterium]|nr:ABC transporter ATP-binding protein [Patescibacteria group bacterium]